MSDYEETSFVYDDNGKNLMLTIRHPRIPVPRKDAIRYLCEHGCSLVPAIEKIPDWLRNIPMQVEQQVIVERLDMLPIYQIHIPPSATLMGHDLAILQHVNEVQYLHIAIESVAPCDLEHLACLRNLEILVLRGLAFTDQHCRKLPRLPALEMLDLQDSAVTSTGIVPVRARFEGVKVYSDEG